MSVPSLFCAPADRRPSTYVPGLVLTRRLRLEPVQHASVEAIHALVKQTEVRRHLFGDHLPTREELSGLLTTAGELFRTTGRGMWSLRKHGSDDVIGFVCLWPFDGGQQAGTQDELAFALSDIHQGRGFAHEACDAIIGYARRQLGWNRLHASADFHNTAANRVLWRLGFAEYMVVRGRSGPLRLFKRAL